MIITRQDLISLCNDFLEDKIDKSTIQDFAINAIMSDDIEWNDNIIAETIFEWDNESINYEINKANINLWKNRLLTDKDELLIHNYWNSHIENQKDICKKYNSKWRPVNKKWIIGVSKNLEKDPINGLRHPSENGTTGWFIWTGEYQETNDFFQPMCAEHLLEKRPEIIKYLGLEVGFRFLADKKGYEDIWYDEKLKEI